MASRPAANGARPHALLRSYKNCFASSTEELAFEKKLFDKTARTSAKAEAEIIILDGLVTVYRNVTDVWLYVVGGQSGETHPDPSIPHIPSVFGRIARISLSPVCSSHLPLTHRLSFASRARAENELVLVNVLTALHEALTSLLRGPPDKRALLDNFDTLLLAIDEMIDSGMILETEATAVVNRVGMK